MPTSRFYASDGRCTYDTPAGAAPLFLAHFPTLNFADRPFTGYGGAAWQEGRVAAGADNVAGTGPLNHFDAAFTGSR